MHNLRGVILDVDGTLVDSNDAHAASWVEALADFGITVDYQAVRKRIGMGGDKLLPAVAGIETSSELGQKLTHRRAEIFTQKYLPHLQPTPEAAQLLARMKGAGLRLAVASSSKKKELQPLLEVCGAERLIEHRTSADDADNSKPDPDIVQAALGQLDIAPEHAIMLGDTPYDIEAAQRSRVAIIALRCGGWADAELTGAVAIYDSPADLLAHYDVSPLGAKQA